MDYRLRIKRLRKLLEENRSLAMIIDDPLSIFYLTGQDLSTGFLAISANAVRLIVDGRYYESCKETSPFPVTLLKEDPVKQILTFKAFENITSFAFDSQTTSYDKYLSLKKTLNPLKVQLKPLTSPVLKIRAIKEDEEVNALRTAADLGSLGFDYVCSILKDGITEAEVARELEIFWKKKGSKGLAFEPIIAFGKNSSMPHYKPGNVALKRGDPVLIDIGVNCQHYHSDMTRVPFFGTPSKVMEEIYHIVKEAQQAALALCKPGVKISDLDQAARKVMKGYGYDQYFTHGLGHGIGLEVHEYPFLRKNSDETLKPGMAITIEPGIYLPGKGGVRIEDTIIIHAAGYENLTARPKDLMVIAP